jgi:hypothetical protein
VDGYDLVALIFAREVSDPLTSLVKNIDRQLAQVVVRRPGSSKLGVFVVFCNDNADLKEQLQELVTKERLKQVVLCTTNSAGPKRYRVARDADLTVVIYEGSETVAANFPLKKGGLDEPTATAILKALTRILPRK